ncbi:phosphodiesterase [Streptomyces sp. NPDC005907]|uniref:phosphodiesterase n=1 Tax=Streptomyces sp. NPDC005907 TaxID=3154571 RepID=UPI0033CB3230
MAAHRSAPALHPAGLLCTATVDVAADGARWGVPWLAAPARHTALVRWSRAAGLPRSWPDAMGLAVRVEAAAGPGRPLDLLLTTSGSGRLGRHLPRMRTNAVGGPYSTLLSYRFGNRPRIIAAFPQSPIPPVGTSVTALADALHQRTIRFTLRAADRNEPWHTFATLTLDAPAPEPAPAPAPAQVKVQSPGFDPYAHHLPLLHPMGRLAGLRTAAYAGSRTGRGAPGGETGNTGLRTDGGTPRRGEPGTTDGAGQGPT